MLRWMENGVSKSNDTKKTGRQRRRDGDQKKTPSKKGGCLPKRKKGAGTE